MLAPWSLFRIIIRIPDEMAYYPVQENEAIFSKKYFLRLLSQFLENLHICIRMPTLPSLLTLIL